MSSQGPSARSPRRWAPTSTRTPKPIRRLTTISQQQAGPQSLGSVKAYFDANPRAAKDMQQLQQPLVNLSTRCKLPVSLPQLIGMVQAAQPQGGGLPGGLPGTLQTAQTTAVPGAVSPASPSPVSAATQGVGPLPGPATTLTR